MIARAATHARSEEAQAPVAEPQPGTIIDDFSVAYRISRGMSADVFAVWHHKLLTPLVCKRIRPEDGGNLARCAQLRTEGRALARLRHPGVVQLIEENTRPPLPYLLLEHVGSRTLRDELRESGAFELGRAVRIVQHIGAAVAYVHSRGLLHRDLKPSNVAMREGRPVLLDFGVAWKLGDRRRRPPDRSGTPQYLAPEQILRAPLSPATDVYGLGALLFELLAGERPFRAGSKDWHKPLEARYPQLSESPNLCALRTRRVPANLCEIVSTSLARDPLARFQSAIEFSAAIDEFTTVKIYPEGLTPQSALLRASVTSATA